LPLTDVSDESRKAQKSQQTQQLHEPKYAQRPAYSVTRTSRNIPMEIKLWSTVWCLC